MGKKSSEGPEVLRHDRSWVNWLRNLVRILRIPWQYGEVLPTSHFPLTPIFQRVRGKALVCGKNFPIFWSRFFCEWNPRNYASRIFPTLGLFYRTIISVSPWEFHRDRTQMVYDRDLVWFSTPTCSVPEKIFLAVVLANTEEKFSIWMPQLPWRSCTK